MLSASRFVPCREVGRLSAEALGLPARVPNQPTDLANCIFTKNIVGRSGRERIFVVMVLEEANPSLASFPSVIGAEDLRAPILWRESIGSIIEAACEDVITNHAQALLAHISDCDPRFSKFHEALGNALNEWSEAAISAVAHRMDAWLTYFFASGAPDFIPMPRPDSIRRLFSPASGLNSFCNPLTITLSQTIFMELQRSPLRSFLSSEHCKDLLLKFDSEDEPLCRESCASERENLQRKISAVTGMLNRLTDVFQRDDEDATVEEEREEEDGVLGTPNMT